MSAASWQNKNENICEQASTSRTSAEDQSDRKRKETDFLELQAALQSKETAIKQLRDELQSSHRSVEQLHQNYACARNLNEAKDATISELRSEVDLLQKALEKAQNEKVQIFDSLYAVQAELSAVTLDKNWLQEQLRSRQTESSIETRSPVSDSSHREDLVQRMEGMRREKEALQELIGTASTIEETVRNLELNRSESLNSKSELNWRQKLGDLQTRYREKQSEKIDEKAILELGTKMSEVEERLKKAVLSQKYQLHVEREQLIQEFQRMQKQVLDHQRHLEVHMQDLASKETIIERLKSTKASLEAEVESLRRDLAAVQTENDRCLQNQRELQYELSTNKREISKLESELENERRQKLFLTTKLEQIESFSAEKVNVCDFNVFFLNTNYLRIFCCALNSVFVFSNFKSSLF